MAEPQTTTKPNGGLTVPSSAAERQISPMEQRIGLVRRTLANNMKALEAVLGKFMEPQRFCRMILTLCQNNPELLKCEVASIVISTLRIAQLQLSPDPALGQAWLIPRKPKGSNTPRAEFQIGFKGYLALAYRSPLVKAVRFGVVAKGETFSYRDGRDWTLIHEPSGGGWPSTLDDVVAAWCIVELSTGGSIPRVMYLPELKRHKSRGQGSQPAWTTDPAPMCVKTVIGDACRRGPFEGEIGRAFSLDHAGETGHGQGEAIDAEFTVVENGGNGESKSTKADTFKRAFGEEAKPEEGAEPAEVAGDDDPLGDALDDAHSDSDAPLDPGTGMVLLSNSQRKQILDAAAAKGMNLEDIQSACAGPLDSAPSSAYDEILSKIKAFKARGRR